ncbi:MAG: elongation factor G [Candidatus Eisenbacteria bacterium]|nr:elongation factor G [Candidatus Eisenbacteria bacterium]MCC7143003.1 elongation factor G [Candidatus Eisenbacteria bacterium]
MKTFDSADIRNIVVAGHSGSGKTTLSEAMIFTAGATSRQGKVADGTSILDHTADETKRKTGIQLSLAQFEYRGKKVNLLDAPGYADFIGEVAAGMKAADFGLIVVSATAGVEPDTERHSQMMDERNLPRFFAVNAMDKEQADYARTCTQIRERVTERAAPLFIPIGSGPSFKGMIDVINEHAYEFSGKEWKEIPVPADMMPAIHEAHRQVVELAAESEDELLEKYLETLELTEEETKHGLHTGILKGTIFPILPVSGDKCLGAGLLLKTMIELGPSPTEEGIDLVDGTMLHCDPSGPKAALIFKITSDLIAQEVALIRCYSGVFENGVDIINHTNDNGERIGHFYHFLGKERSDADKLVAGDIAAAAKLKTAHVNHSIGEKGRKVVIAPIVFPPPVHEVAIAPKHKGDEDKVGTAFHKLHEEDPTFKLELQAELHQTVLKAMGDQHVDVIIDRLRRRFSVEVEASKPRVAFRETIKGTADVSYRHKKQTGGRGQFADVSIKVEPVPRGGGYEFVNNIVGGVIPSRFIPAVEKGLNEKKERGTLAGYPVVDFRVRLHFGSYHDVDSSEMAFKVAGRMALKNALEQASPTLLEPIMMVTVLVPDDYMGDVMGDLSSRRGKIQGMEPDGRVQKIKAAVPQVELYRYSTTLRSLTQGRARYAAEFSHYEEVPREAQDKLVEQLRKEMVAIEEEE